MEIENSWRQNVEIKGFCKKVQDYVAYWAIYFVVYCIYIGKEYLSVFKIHDYRFLRDNTLGPLFLVYPALLYCPNSTVRCKYRIVFAKLARKIMQSPLHLSCRHNRHHTCNITLCNTDQRCRHDGKIMNISIRI